MVNVRTPILRDLPWRWILYWLVVPNLIVILMWPVGGPPMLHALLISGTAAFIAAQLPWLWAQRVILSLATLLVAFAYIGKSFNVTLYNYEIIFPFLREVRPMRSPEYIAGGAIVLFSIAVVCRYAPAMAKPNGAMGWLLAGLGFLGLINLDTLATAKTAGSYHGLPESGTPFDSAVRQAGIESSTATGRNVVVILVEALGMPTSPAERSYFEADWNRSRWKSRYDVRQGAVPYFGSTTNAELRELCGSWADLQDFDFVKADCLPSRFRQAGYEATAIHGFTPEFFDRRDWWPRAGFDQMLFRGDLRRIGAGDCGGVFPGSCDTDIPEIIGRRLRAAERPQFIYWVTLNTHLPILADDALGTAACETGSPAIDADVPMLCRLFLLHHRLADAIDRMAMDPSLPPTDILLVGDHMPPFFQRDARVRFDGERVPWVYLRAKDRFVSPVR